MTRIALITGGGSGIGRASALGLAREGWTIAVVGRTKSALDETIELAGNGIACTCDMTHPDAVETMFDDVRDRFGRIDLLFNNAGVFAPTTEIDELSLQSWNLSLNVNLTGYFLGIQNAFRIMRAQTPSGGRIINNGSLSAHVPRPGSVAYTVSKHGVTGLTKAASLEGRAYGIACGQIDIGNASSNITAGFNGGTLQADGGIRPEPTFDLAQVADAVVLMANLPLEANVQFMTLMATNMPFIGRG
jgi:NAD(P)-dependent dehydrogenase (short-subunit alcohol dehydrogenase family)